MPYEKFDSTWISVTIERNFDIWQYERSVYTLLELISDVGGFTSALLVMLALTAQTWNFNNLDNFMVSRLFKIKKTKEEIAEHPEEFFNQSDFIRVGNFPYFKEWFKRMIPKKCWFCKQSRREIALKLARDKLDKEINIIEMVKSWRYYEQAFKYLLPEK